MNKFNIIDFTDANVPRGFIFSTLNVLSRLSYRPTQEKYLLFATNLKGIEIINQSNHVGGVVTHESLLKHLNNSIGVVLSPNPQSTFWDIHDRLCKVNYNIKYAPSYLSSDIKLGANVYIDPQGVSISEGSVIGSNSVILQGTNIGKNVIIGPGSVIGNCGFQVIKKLGINSIVNQCGGVEIKDNVRIGANCTIDKGIFTELTTIHEGAMLDNLVHIGHSAIIGKNNIITAGVIISGGVELENDVRIDPNASVGHSIKVDDNAYLTIGSVVIEHVKKDTRVSGNFGIDHQKFIKNFIKAKK